MEVLLNFALLSLLSIRLHGCIHRMSALSRVNTLNICDAALPALLNPMVRFWHPCGWLPGLDAVIVHLINLFKRQSLGLRDEKVREDKTAETSCSPNEKHLGAQSCISGSCLDQVRGGITDSPIPEPIGGCGHRHGFGTNALKTSDLIKSGSIREDKAHRWRPKRMDPRRRRRRRCKYRRKRLEISVQIRLLSVWWRRRWRQCIHRCTFQLLQWVRVDDDQGYRQPTYPG